MTPTSKGSASSRYTTYSRILTLHLKQTDQRIIVPRLNLCLYFEVRGGFFLSVGENRVKFATASDGKES
jgi:hypothetical protein